MFIMLNNEILRKEDIIKVFFSVAGNINAVIRGIKDGKVSDEIETLEFNVTESDASEKILEIYERLSLNIVKKNETIYPDSTKCLNRKDRKIDEKLTIYECIPCAEKNCNEVFGTSLCEYHYKEKKEEKNNE